MLVVAQQPFGKGWLKVSKVAPGAVRIQYATNADFRDSLPDWLYIRHSEVDTSRLSVRLEGEHLSVCNGTGQPLFTATSHRLADGVATLKFLSPSDEALFGLGQFQDGYSNVRGLSRRLTQVNTQISLPMLLSSKGYAVLWNNYGLTEFNPCSQQVSLQPKKDVPSQTELVNVTSIEGGKQELHERHFLKRQ